MTQEQLAALKVNLHRELEFCDKKTKDLEQMAKRKANLTEAVLMGVTYSRNGLGGSYGGMPRARQSMLDGVWDYRSDVETEFETGSEVTDLADSWIDAVEQQSVQEQDVTSGVLEHPRPQCSGEQGNPSVDVSHSSPPPDEGEGSDSAMEA